MGTIKTGKHFGRYQAYYRLDGQYHIGGSTGHQAATRAEALKAAWREALSIADIKLHGEIGRVPLVYDNKLEKFLDKCPFPFTPYTWTEA